MYDPGTAAIIAATITAGATVHSTRQTRKSTKGQELITSKQIASEKEQLLKEERAIEESKISARQSALQERRTKARRRGRSSTIIAGRSASPNLTQLGQVRKKELLGSGA